MGGWMWWIKVLLHSFTQPRKWQTKLGSWTTLSIQFDKQTLRGTSESRRKERQALGFPLATLLLHNVAL